MERRADAYSPGVMTYQMMTGESPFHPNLCNRCNTHVELSVLFAELSTFTELTHELGPERTHEVIDAFLQIATMPW